MLTYDRANVITFSSSASIKCDFTSDKSALKSAVNSILASGGTNVDAGLTKSLSLFESDSSSNTNIIVLICDGDVNCPQTTIDLANSKNIDIYTVLIGGSTSGKSDLQDIAEQTGGKFFYAQTAEEIRRALFDTQQEALEGVDTTDTDGDGLYDTYEIAGMIIPNGQRIESDPLDPDTDGDGLTDGEEMGLIESFEDQHMIKKIILTFKGFNSIIYAEYFDYKSNPNLKDSDGDDAFDDVDAYPLVFNELKAYIFYPLTGEDFLVDEVNDRYSRISKMMEVENIDVATANEFISEWNNMGYNSQGKLEWIISDVYTVFHGDPTGIFIGNGEWISEDNINKLANLNINILHLSSCNNGNLDFINVWSYEGKTKSQNMAIQFLKNMSNIKEVYAWDGYSTYKNGKESACGSHWYNLFLTDFQKYSIAKNNYQRKATGLIKYYRDTYCQIKFSPNYKIFLDMYVDPTDPYTNNKISINEVIQ